MIKPLLVVLLLAACGANQESDMQTVHARADGWTVRLNELAEAVRPVAALIDRVCARRGDNSTDCQMARAAWATAREAINAAQDAVQFYYDTGALPDPARDAIQRASNAASVVLAAQRRMEEIINGLDTNNSGGSSDRPDSIWPQDPATNRTGVAPSPAGTPGNARTGTSSPESDGTP
jgi:hypothetical protein